MKHILIIIATLSIGGAEKVALEIGLGALAKGYLVHYLVFGDQIGAYEGTVQSNGGAVIHIPSPSTNYEKYYRTLKKLMRENQYDIVHAHTMFNIGWAMLAAKEVGIPVRIAHAHSALNDGCSLKKKAYEKVMRWLILKNSTYLVACGDAAGERLYGKQAYEERGICILNGVNTSAFLYQQDSREQIRKELDLEHAFIIGHVGHLASVKNQSFLIRLMPELLKKKPNASLLMLGDGEDRPMLLELARELGVSDHVVMTGNVSNVSDYLSAMDVFAFPSLYEGMPLSILEVQSNGLPCILSTGVPKDVYQTDLIQPLSLEQPRQWIQAICNAKRNSPEKYAKELTRKGFDSKSVVDKFLDLYERADSH